MSEKSPSSSNRLCLDFANATTGIASYGELVSWSREAWILGEQEERALFVEGRLHPDPAARILRRSVELRELLRRTLAAVAAGKPPDDGNLGSIGRWVALGASHRRLVATPRGVRFRWAASAGDLDRMLWPVAQSAADLLTSEEISRLRACEECERFFLDTTKNRSRRFCTKACGDRVKSRRYYRRLRGSAAP